MKIDTGMCIVIVDPKPMPAAELARSLQNWVGGDCRVVRAASIAEAEAVLALDGPLKSVTTRVLLAADDVGTGSHSGFAFLNGIKDPLRAKLRLRGLLTKEPQTPQDDGIVRFGGEPGSDEMMYHFVHLLRSGGSDVANVTVIGNDESDRTHRVKRFLDLNRVPYRPERRDGQSVEVRVGNTRTQDPGPLELAEQLNLVQCSGSSAKGDYDVVVVGGGPAGMSAAVCASGMGLRTLVLEDDAAGGQAGTSINRVENYFGFPGGVAAPDLVQRGLNQAFNLNVIFLPGLRATSLELCEVTPLVPRYRVGWTTEKHQTGSVTAGVVVIASGRVPRRVIAAKSENEQEIKNESTFTDHGLYYDALPKDATAAEGEKIAIIGAGDAAGRAAAMFARRGARVTLIVRGAFSMGAKLEEEVRDLVRNHAITLKQPFEVTGFRGKSDPQRTYLEKVVIEHTGSREPQELDVDRAYALIGGVPSTKWLPGQKLALDRRGFVLTEVRNGLPGPVLPMQTSMPGVFAIGDVRAPGIVQRIAQAAGQGAAVAVSIDLYLREAPAGILADKTSPAFAFYGPVAADSPLTVPAQSPAPADARVKAQDR